MRRMFSIDVLAIVLLTLLACSDKPTDPGNISFPDPNFEALIRAVLDMPAGDIMPEDMLAITELDGLGRNITDITGIEHCTNLDSLKLILNQIADISPLSGLTNLTLLWLWGNVIADISPLSGLTNLTNDPGDDGSLYIAWSPVP